eukprot:SAG11_NODE_542_length_8640_cov_5.667603_8_plen_58_part_00
MLGSDERRIEAHSLSWKGVLVVVPSPCVVVWLPVQRRMLVVALALALVVGTFTFADD